MGLNPIASSIFMQKEVLINYISKGLSSYDIAKQEGISKTTVQYWLNKYLLKTKPNSKNRVMLLDWLSIQNYYDNGMTYNDLTKKFNICKSTLTKANKIGLFKARKASDSLILSNESRLPFKHSKETKQKLSKYRKLVLYNNKQSTWQTKENGTSIPCELFKEILRGLNIDFVEEFQPLREIKRFFAIDIAFPDMKFGIEINGNQHYDTNGDLKSYYQNRHNLIVDHGWELLETKYNKVFNKSYLDKIIQYIKLKMPPKHKG